jgi:hypothetical protein
MNMGCCSSCPVTDFVKANNKNELKQCYNNEINRIKIMRETIKIDPSKPNEDEKFYILDKILHEDNWVILPLVEACSEEHIKKIKFLLFDYFMVTETWNKKEFEDHFIKIMNFYKDERLSISIIQG